MIKTRPYYQLIPDKVFNDLLVIQELLRTEIKSFSADRLKEVISIICCHTRKPKDKSARTAPIRMEYLKKVVPQGDKYLNGLITIGIAERTGNYKPGVKSYRYSISEAYQSQYIQVPLENAKLQRTIESTRIEVQKNERKSFRNRSEQVKFLRNLSIDLAYKGYINNYYRNDTDEYNCRLAAAQRIINGDIRYKVDNAGHRFHSNITNISKDLRSYLRINGEQLVNIDIKNSQPYLSTLILTNPGKISRLTNDPAFTMLLQSLDIPQTEDVNKYISLVNSGQLYEYMISEFKREGLLLSRDETKRQVLRVLYARNRSPKNPVNRKCRQVFSTCFPTVHRVFSKVRGSERGDKFHGYKRFAILMQRVESHLMLDVILKRINRELPGTIAVTIHDSIMTGKDETTINAIRKIMEDEFAACVGFKPNIKVDNNDEKKEEESKEREVININHYDATNLASVS